MIWDWTSSRRTRPRRLSCHPLSWINAKLWSSRGRELCRAKTRTWSNSKSVTRSWRWGLTLCAKCVSRPLNWATSYTSRRNASSSWSRSYRSSKWSRKAERPLRHDAGRNSKHPWSQERRRASSCSCFARWGDVASIRTCVSSSIFVRPWWSLPHATTTQASVKPRTLYATSWLYSRRTTSSSWRWDSFMIDWRTFSDASSSWRISETLTASKSLTLSIAPCRHS